MALVAQPRVSFQISHAANKDAAPQSFVYDSVNGRGVRDEAD